MVHWAKYIKIGKDSGLHGGRKHTISLSHDGCYWNSLTLTRREMRKLVKEINTYLKNLEK